MSKPFGACGCVSQYRTLFVHTRIKVTIPWGPCIQGVTPILSMVSGARQVNIVALLIKCAMGRDMGFSPPSFDYVYVQIVYGLWLTLCLKARSPLKWVQPSTRS